MQYDVMSCCVLVVPRVRPTWSTGTVAVRISGIGVTS